MPLFWKESQRQPRAHSAIAIPANKMIRKCRIYIFPKIFSGRAERESSSCLLGWDGELCRLEMNRGPLGRGGREGRLSPPSDVMGLPSLRPPSLPHAITIRWHDGKMRPNHANIFVLSVMLSIQASGRSRPPSHVAVFVPSLPATLIKRFIGSEKLPCYIFSLSLLNGV